MGYLMNKIVHIDRKAMNDAAKSISQKTKKSKTKILLDMIYCGLKYQAGYNDYVEFEFYNMNNKQRSTYLTQGKNNLIIRKYNNKDFAFILDNKIEFNKRFNDYLNRDWIYLKTSSYDEFVEFVSFYKKIIAKVIDGEGGNGITIYDTFDLDPAIMYDELKHNKQYLIEECIIQHPIMESLYDKSVNSLRLFTFYKNGRTYFLNGILKIGNGGVVDNFSSGGMYAFINDDGIIDTPAIDKLDHEYIKHPISNTNIVGFKIPLFNEAIELVKNAHLQIPEVGYIGWDVAIGVKKPMIIEGNFYPGIFQKKASYSNGEGLLSKYKQYMSIGE